MMTSIVMGLWMLSGSDGGQSERERECVGKDEGEGKDEGGGEGVSEKEGAGRAEVAMGWR